MCLPQNTSIRLLFWHKFVRPGDNFRHRAPGDVRPQGVYRSITSSMAAWQTGQKASWRVNIMQFIAGR